MNRSSSLDLEALQQELSPVYPDLRLFKEEDRLVVRGSFPVLFEGTALDRFQVEAHIQPDFPDEVPHVWEIGGRIPRVAARHIEQSGGSCLLVPEEWLTFPREKRTLLSFFQIPVHNYFLYQCFVEAGLPWPHGERSHGLKGVLEAYADMLGAEEPQIVSYLDLLTRRVIKGHWLCPCGSGKIIRQCHRDKIRELQDRISPEVASKAMQRLAFYIHSSKR